ncbi:toll-like receptor 8 [Haliotis rubra]|uniref:toll-like receptor 8 n=1 Tax=Haliotis rubra TaxID=36100 RepID=UPI001EE5E3BE|nr:toll-like receptor 8 [Haliotis rubra]
MMQNELLTIVTLWLIVPGLLSQMDDINRCVYEVNERDLVANCSSRNLTAVPQGFVKNVTVIDLTMNKITSIGKMSFPYPLKVHTLSLHQNLLTHLDEGSLKNLPELSKLDLGGNSINFTSLSLPTGLFRGLPLKRLLMSNMSGILNAEYPEDAFLDLHQLQELSIDAPPNPTFGVGFLNMTNLQTLTISFCEKESLNTSAFEVFQKFNLSAFQINACDIGQVDTNITDIFPNLDILDIRDTVGTDLPKRLMSLKNYENSSMQRVSFIKNVAGDKDPTEYCNMLSKDLTRYLITMCVSEVYLIGNKIQIIERGTLIQPPFSECLRVLDLSHNMILDEYGILETLYFYPNLVSFHFEQFLEDLKQVYHQVFHFYDASSIFQDTNETVWPPHNPETCLFTVGAEKRDNEVILQNERSKREILILVFPRNLTSLYFAPSLKPFANIEHNLVFWGTEKWSKVRFSNCSVLAKNVKFFGLENLKSLEISGNGFTELPTTFMKSFPNIQNLSLNHITHGFGEISENIDSEDPQWVCSTLRQKLEDERELRLCIPERDFDPGVYTCEEVLGAINQSWKTIIYLTQTFLEDELCSFRLSSAIYVGENLTSDRFIILYSDAVFRHPLPSIINQLLDKDNRFPIERFHESSLWDQLHSRILCKD